jgi:hypothetical protein
LRHDGGGQHQGRLDSQIRIERLTSTRLASWVNPADKSFRRYPKGQTATAAKARLILHRFLTLNFILPTRWRCEALCLCGMLDQSSYFQSALHRCKMLKSDPCPRAFCHGPQGAGVSCFGGMEAAHRLKTTSDRLKFHGKTDFDDFSYASLQKSSFDIPFYFVSDIPKFRICNLMLRCEIRG